MDKIKVAFDAQLIFEQQKTGIGWCAASIMNEMLEQEEVECSFNYFYMKRGEEKEKIIKSYTDKGAISNPCKWFHVRIYKMISRMIPLSYHFFFGKKAKITQFFNYEVAPGVSGKVATIVYDMAYRTCPETVAVKTRQWLEQTLERSCKRAEHIFTISEFSKQEIIKYLKLPKEKITVIPMGANPEYYHPNYSIQQIEQVKKKYKIEKEYFLYLGTLEPRKNIERIIEAYAVLARKKENVPQLVLAGRKGWMYDSIFEKVKQYKLEQNIVFTGYVEEEECPILMKGAEAFVFPSLYEGFGMPPLEAMSCGTPVITSNTTALPEVVGSAGCLVDPLDVSQITDAMEKIWTDEAYAAELQAAGLEQAKKFTWTKSVQIMKKVYKELLEEK